MSNVSRTRTPQDSAGTQFTFVQDRNADAYALCNFTRGSTSVAELPDSLRSLFRAKAFVCA